MVMNRIRSLAVAFVATGLALTVGCGDQATTNPDMPSPAAPSFSADLPDGTEGQPYDATLTVKDGARPFTWDATGLPAGLTLTGQDDQAHLTGTAPAGRFTVTIRVADALQRMASQTAELRVRSSLSIAGTLPEATEGESIDALLTVSGGIGQGYNWSLGDHAPANVNLGQASGRTVHLTATVVAGTIDVPVIVEDTNGGHATSTLQMIGYPHLELVTALVPNAQKGAPYTATLAAKGGHSTAYAWEVVAGTLPNGIALVGGVLSGTPTTLGHFTFTIAVHTSADPPVSRAFEITVGDNPPQITTTTLPRATWGVAYLADVAAQSHASGALTWRLLSGTLPPGVTLDGSAATAHLTGTPRVRGTFSFTLEATDAGGSASATFSVTVDRLDRLAVSAATLPRGRVGRAYDAELRALDAHGAVTWTLSVDSLPPGLAISNGHITGVPTSAGWYRFTVKVTDADQRTASRTLAIGINRDAGHLLVTWPVFVGQSTVRVLDISQRTRGSETVLDAGNGKFDYVNDFSPGGNFATYSIVDGADNRLLYLVNLRGGTITQTLLSSNARPSGYVGEWSPDEHWFAWHDEFSWHVTDLSAATPTTENLNLTDPVLQVFWSPDSSRLLVPTSAAALIWQSGRPLTRVQTPVANAMRWTADGNGVLCALAAGPLNGTVYYVSLADPTPVALTPSFDFNFFYVAPDFGTVLATDAYATHHSGDDTLYAVDLRDEQIGLATIADRGVLSLPSWSGDGQRVLSLHGGAMYVFERAQLFAGGATPLAIMGATDAGWGADSNHVVYQANGLNEASISGGTPEAIGAAGFGDWQWLAPERRVYVYLSGNTLSTIDLATPSPRTAVQLDVQVPWALWTVSHGLQSTVWWSEKSRRVQLADLGGATPGSPVKLFDIPDIGLILDQVRFTVSP